MPNGGPSAAPSSSSQLQSSANRGSSSSHNYTTYSSGYSGSNYANSSQTKPSFVSSISFRNNNNNASSVGNSNANGGNQYERILTSLNQNNLGSGSATKTNNFLTSTSTSGPNYSPSNYSSNIYDTLNYSSYLQNELKNQQFMQQQQQTLVGPTYTSSRSKSVSIYDIKKNVTLMKRKT